MYSGQGHLMMKKHACDLHHPNGQCPGYIVDATEAGSDDYVHAHGKHQP